MVNITIGWHDPERTTILLTLERGWTWDEWNDALAEATQMRASVPNPVPMILDAIRGADLPTIRATSQIRHAWETMPRDGSLLVVVGVRGPLVELTVMIARMSGQERRLFFVDTIAQAEDLLRQRKDNSDSAKK